MNLLGDDRPEAEELYRALLNGGRLAQLRRLTYRCHGHRCTLLDAIETPLGILLHQIRFKNSNEVNLAQSNAAGRASNTYDGDRHWLSRTYYIDQSALSQPDWSGSLSVNCDHVLWYPITPAEFHRDWDARHAEVRIRADHSRYAVD